MSADGAGAPHGPRAVGDAAPLFERTVRQTDIDRYAEATGDHNPIHVDPEYSATGPFGRTIAHGLMTLAYAAEMLNRWTGGAFDEGGEIEVAFIGPVFVDDRIRLHAEVTEVEADGTAICALSCTAGERKVLAGTVRFPTSTEKESSDGA